VAFAVLLVARFVALVGEVNSRFLTGPSALFGMTRVVGGGGLFVALGALLLL
jgi:hypothetical protein